MILFGRFLSHIYSVSHLLLFGIQLFYFPSQFCSFVSHIARDISPNPRYSVLFLDWLMWWSVKALRIISKYLFSLIKSIICFRNIQKRGRSCITAWMVVQIQRESVHLLKLCLGISLTTLAGWTEKETTSRHTLISYMGHCCYWFFHV